jgi:uncharacterized membrane protein (UPF0182 family)
MRLRKPSKGRVVISIVLGAILALFLSARGLSSFYVNLLWFDSVGRSDVYWRTIRAQFELGLIFTLVAAVFIWINLMLADRLAPVNLPNTPEDQAVMRVRQATARYRGRLRIAVSLFIGLMLGIPAASRWESWLLFLNGKAFPVADPQFDTNVGFYVFRLPFAEFVVSWAFGMLVLATLLTVAFHFINGSIRPQDKVQRVSPQAKVHLSVLLAGAALIRAANYWLSRFDLTRSSRGVVRGALYTDVNAQLPAINLMILVSIAVAALLLWNIRQKGWRLPALAVGLWVVVAIVAGTVYPAVIQRFVVQPNVSTRELPFISRNIEATKLAMGISEVERVETTFDDLSSDDVNDFDVALRDVRQLDPIQMRDRFILDEGRTSFYTVRDLDVDRYSIDGRTQQVLIASRELNTAGIPNRTWVSRHLLYTHGCGIIAAPASVVTDDGRPAYVDLNVKRPELYFGDGLANYAIVGTSQTEQACPDSEAGAYTGGTGVKMNNFLRRVAFAVHFGEYNLFGSRLITQESEMLWVRDIRDRVRKIAPFLHFDADPYPVVVNGEVKWIIDAFTTTSRYPYAENADTTQISGASGLNHSFNYVRNSVKTVVDSYTGEVKFYIADPKDPIVRAWSAAFPKMFSPLRDLDPVLREHLRFPEDLFRVQTNMYGRYQFDDATLFFNRDAAWSISQAPPLEPQGSTAAPIQSLNTTAANVDSINVDDANVVRFNPYFTIFHAPGTADSGVFSMLRPFVPFSPDGSRKELRSFMVVSSDPSTYGKITVYDVRSPLPAGPSTVAAEFESDTVIAEIITPLDLRGSRVTYGDLQIVPVSKGIIYLRPMYIQPDSADSKQVFVRKFLGYYDGQAVIGDSVTDTVRLLFPGFNVDLGDRVRVPGSRPPTTTVPTSPDNATPTTTTTAPPAPSGTSAQNLLARAEQLFKEADEALAKSPPDFATYQQKQAEARELLKRAVNQLD